MALTSASTGSREAPSPSIHSPDARKQGPLFHRARTRVGVGTIRIMYKTQNKDPTGFRATADVEVQVFNLTWTFWMSQNWFPFRSSSSVVVHRPHCHRRLYKYDCEWERKKKQGAIRRPSSVRWSSRCAELKIGILYGCFVALPSLSHHQRNPSSSTDGRFELVKLCMFFFFFLWRKRRKSCTLVRLKQAKTVDRRRGKRARNEKLCEKSAWCTELGQVRKPRKGSAPATSAKRSNMKGVCPKRKRLGIEAGPCIAKQSWILVQIVDNVTKMIMSIAKADFAFIYNNIAFFLSVQSFILYLYILFCQLLGHYGSGVQFLFDCCAVYMYLHLYRVC